MPSAMANEPPVLDPFVRYTRDEGALWCLNSRPSLGPNSAPYRGLWPCRFHRRPGCHDRTGVGRLDSRRCPGGTSGMRFELDSTTQGWWGHHWAVRCNHRL